MCWLWKVFVFEDRARSTESFQSEGDTTFDLLFLRGGIHVEVLTEVDVTTSSILLLSVLAGAPNVNFRKTSVRKTIWDLEFSEHLL